jgi:ribose/xylose/arabinose/galactoside ABC-type transport system permease subunit
VIGAVTSGRLKRAGRPGRGTLGLWLGLLAIILVAAYVSPGFIQPINFFNMLRQASVVGIASVGVTLVMITGGVDLSIGAIISFASVLAASLMAGQAANIPLAIGAALVMGAIVGLANGLLVARWKLPAFILTLGTATVLLGIAQLYTGGTAAGVVAPEFRQVLNARLGPVPVLVIVFGLVVLLGLGIQNRTAFGRRLYLVGSNGPAARLAGVPVQRTLVLAYVISGLTAAVAGLALLARSGVSSTFAGQGFEFDVLAAVILGGTTFEGGRGGIGGTLAGVLILATTFSLVSILGLDFNMELIVKGAIIFGVAALHVMSLRREEGT